MASTKNNDDEDEDEGPCVMRPPVDLTLRQAQWTVPSRNAPSPASGARSPESFASTPRHVPSLSTVTQVPPPPWLATESASPASPIPSLDDLVDSIQNLQEIRNALHIERDKTLARLQDLDARVAAAERKIQQQLALQSRHRRQQYAARSPNSLLSPPQSPTEFRRQYGMDDAMDVDGREGEGEGEGEVDQLALAEEGPIIVRRLSSASKRDKDENEARDQVPELPRLRVSRSPTQSPQANGPTTFGSVPYLHVSHLRGQPAPSRDDLRRPTPSLAAPPPAGRPQAGHQSPLDLLASVVGATSPMMNSSLLAVQPARATRSPQPTWTTAGPRVPTPARVARAQDDSDHDSRMSGSPATAAAAAAHKRELGDSDGEEEEDDEDEDGDDVPESASESDGDQPLARKRGAPKRRRVSAAQQFTFVEGGGGGVGGGGAPAGPHRRKPQNKRHSRGGRIVCEHLGAGGGRCGQRFTRQADMVRHRENIHGAHDGKYRCPVCAKSLSRADAVKRHVLHSDDANHMEFQRRYGKEIDGGGDWWQALAPAWRKMTLKV